MSAPFIHSSNPANPASLVLRDRAAAIVGSLPPVLATDAALVGSPARGLADAESDLDLNLWVAVIPPLAERVAWLEQLGATAITPEAQPRDDGSHMIAARLTDPPLEVEVGWQTFADFETWLGSLLSGAHTAPKDLQLAELIDSSWTLRDSGRLRTWCEALSAYPEALRTAILHDARAFLTDAERIRQRATLAARGESLALLALLIDDLRACTRILYASNRRWQPKEKWALTIGRTFAPAAIATLAAAVASPTPEAVAAIVAEALADQAFR